MNKICTLIKVSLPTARKYLKELENLQLVKRTEKGLLITDKYFITGKTPKQKQIELILERNKDCEPLFKRFNKTNWNKINNPAEYETAVVAGYVNIKKETKAEVPLITL